MEVTWFGAKEREGIASFYSSNITLNTVASYPLLDAYRVQVGKDEQGRLLIVPVTNEKAESGVYDEYALLPYEVRRSFSRINSSSLMRQLEKAYGLELSSQPRKFPTHWDSKENILYVEMDKEVK